MLYKLSFTKLTGAGNDFVLIDNREDVYKLQWNEAAKNICDRHFGIGADGLLVLEKSVKHDFKLNYFNSDGSYGGLCGNGGRCAAYYYFLNDAKSNLVHFESLGKKYTAEKNSDSIRLRMKDVRTQIKKYAISINKKNYAIHFLDVGSPHAIFFLDKKKGSLAKFPVDDIGRKIRFHKKFSPKGTNVNFVSQFNSNTIEMRTYERGVESETLACGTGSVATALVSATLFEMKSPIHLIPTSKQQLSVHFKSKNDIYTDVWLEGPAKIVFAGKFEISHRC